MPSLDVASLSHVGRVRKSQEDALWCGDHQFVLSDGMGGAAAGEVASAVTVATAAASLLRKESPFLAAAAADHAVSACAVLRPQWHEMGATIVVLTLAPAPRRQLTYELAHIGDSRAYLARRGRIWQLTRDHANGHRLTRAVGHGGTPSERRGEVGMGDTLLLCSDGLTNMVPDKKITPILAKAEDARAACTDLVDAANAAGGHDNVSVIVVRVRP